MSNTPLWSSPQPARRSLRGTAQADLCVVGLGGSGLAAVRAGLEAGMRVIGLDASQVAAGAAGRNGGFLLAGPAWFHHDARERVGRDLAARMYAETLNELARMEHQPSVRRVGSLRISGEENEADDVERHFAALREDEIEAERYKGPEGRGILVPSDAVFDPFAHCVWQASDVVRGGAQLFERSPVTRVEAGVVTTRDGAVHAPRIVVAVDGGLAALVPSLANAVSTWRLQMLGTAPVGRTLSRHAVYSRFGYDYWQQLPDGRVTLGGGRDVGGEAERDAALCTTIEVQSHLDRVLREQIGTEAEVTHRWAGRVCYTPDGMPVCHEFAVGAIAIGAYCGTGNIIGRILGREVIQRWHGGPSPFLEALSLARSDQTPTN
jgi:gamma-glutamylputrescine oxidase